MEGRILQNLDLCGLENQLNVAFKINSDVIGLLLHGCVGHISRKHRILRVIAGLTKFLVNF